MSLNEVTNYCYFSLCYQIQNEINIAEILFVKIVQLEWVIWTWKFQFGIVFIWDISELSVRYNGEIIEEKVVLLAQDFHDGTIINWYHYLYSTMSACVCVLGLLSLTHRNT